jgi:26S proteasome regulatory subunit N7
MASLGKDEQLLDEMETEVVVEEEEKTYPDMELSQKAFLLETPEGQSMKDEVMEGVKADSMAPFYEHLCTKHGWMADEALLASMKEANVTELEKLKAALVDAEENQGEMEVLDGLFAIASFHARTGGKADAYEAFDVIIAKQKVRTCGQYILVGGGGYGGGRNVPDLSY